ncbi:hypothetical protein GCM10010193_02170 [Kitasatospora atroaurantiaca]|uniref:Protein phosphatase 2C-like protein n=1 Tax=Kitasatospora atroaurantiaca TaxID=285545 RepID=A0A561ELE1_9ACTN|nr:protein phosphatase 2C domain-containing protein [Kitasatospora atroaurantiaca]TWE16438.1 protein phosphatase 2C-like protein [Kitasatospora atroaurantiaca]
MSNQGAPPQHRPEDGWWHTVYEGPAGTLPDTPDASAGEGSVDDWFDSAAGMIGVQRTGDRPAPPEPAADDAEPAVSSAAPADASVDDWFDSAAGMIGSQRTGEPAAEQPPAEQPAPEPEPSAPASAAPASDGSDSGSDSAATALPAAEDPAPAPAAQEPESTETATIVEPPDPMPSHPATAKPYQPPVPHVGERPPTYGPEPTALPASDPDMLAALVPDTVLEGAQYGAATLRAVSVRGDSARYRGESRRDALLVTRFGEGEEGLLLAVLGAPSRSQIPSSLAAEACKHLAAAIGRSRPELAADLRAGARDRLRYGLQRLTARAAVPLRSSAATGPTGPDEPDDPIDEPAPDGQSPDLSSPDSGSLHCLLVSLDPEATHRAAFGIGPGGLYLLRSGHWIDAYAARLLHHPDGRPPAPATADQTPRPFRFRLVPATPGDILLLCTPGLAEPIADEPAVAHFLSSHWAHPHPPGTVDFLRQVQVRAKGYADDRTAAVLWTE